MGIRECGDCTLCCTLLGIHQLDKAPFQHCFHCEVGKECRIYTRRPEECKDFDCMWLLGATPEELKPSRTHVVLADVQEGLKKKGYELENRTVVGCYVDPAYPNSYKEGAIKEYLNSLLAKGVEIILIEKGRNMLLKWGKIDE